MLSRCIFSLTDPICAPVCLNLFDRLTFNMGVCNWLIRIILYLTIEQGGAFVLEPQPWRSYEQNRNVSEVPSFAHLFIFLWDENHDISMEPFLLRFSSVVTKESNTTIHDIIVSLFGFWQVTAKTYKTIVFRPEQFREILLDKVLHVL